nr:homocysteine S-methyltransferase family protein [Micromonospora sp. DSM 115978]
MTVQPAALPQLDGELWIADGGLETTLLFVDGIDLPYFAAFPLVEGEAGRAALTRYYQPYLDLAESRDIGIVLDTPTWRASLDWGALLGYDAARLESVNRQAVRFVAALLADRPTRSVLNGAVGPRGDGYVVGATMSIPEATEYHRPQAEAFAAAGAGMMTAVTMNYVEEAIGVANAATSAGLPVVVSFTVETDGRLPSGMDLGEAISVTDAATDGAVAYYMVNCAHPTHFAGVFAQGGDWIQRVRGIRANASALSHAELDQATELDRGDPTDLADRYRRLRASLPSLAVVGGCCGTDHEHIQLIATALATPA